MAKKIRDGVAPCRLRGPGGLFRWCRTFGAELDPADYPQSTFAMDVDTASYEYAKNLIDQGRRPAPDDVRPEEFINAFRQDYAQPDGNGFSVQLHAEDSTDLEDGLITGYRVARDGFRPGATNRVVLLSDGLANTGATEAAPILERVREEADKQITLLGVGVGSDYGDSLIEQLADRGDGFAVYVSERDRARQVFADQLPATLALRALDAKVQVTFDPHTVAAYRLIGYDDRTLDSSAFRDDRVDGGEIVAGYSVTALYTVRLRSDASGTVAHAQIHWQDPTSRAAQENGSTISVSRLGAGFTDAAPRLRVDYAAAYFAEDGTVAQLATEIRRVGS